MSLISPQQFAMLRALVVQGVALADIAFKLELDVDSVREWTAVLDGPGPLDVTLRNDGGELSLTVGPFELVAEGDDVELRLDIPGERDLVLEHVDGELRGPRLEQPEAADPTPAELDVSAPLVTPEHVADLRALLAGRGMKLRRAILAGTHDAQLEELAVVERLGRGRGTVLGAVRRRLRALER